MCDSSIQSLCVVPCPFLRMGASLGLPSDLACGLPWRGLWILLVPPIGTRYPLPLITTPIHVLLFLVLAEVNLFWASHQTHHSSEDYTLSTALRQSFSQRFTSMVSGSFSVCYSLHPSLPPSVRVPPSGAGSPSSSLLCTQAVKSPLSILDTH